MILPTKVGAHGLVINYRHKEETKEHTLSQMLQKAFKVIRRYRAGG